MIAGTARRINLKTPEGLDTRPTQDRIKETLFNILQFDLEGQDVLDLFSGSGALGIEALSRGAKRAVFCDAAKQAVLCIEENLEKTHFKEQALVLPGDYNGAINALMRKDYHFGLVFMDPPRAGSTEEFLLALRRLAPEKIVYISCDPKTQARDLKYLDSAYAIRRIAPVDMFPFTDGIENVVLLEKIHF